MSFIAFLKLLIKKLDETEPNWRLNHVILCDRAPIHTKKVVRDFLDNNAVPYLFSGPASFYVLPVEGVFG